MCCTISKSAKCFLASKALPRPSSAIGFPIFSLSSLSKKLGHVHFVVTDDDGGLRGMISLEDLDLPEDEMLRNLVLIEDMVVDGRRGHRRGG